MLLSVYKKIIIDLENSKHRNFRSGESEMIHYLEMDIRNMVYMEWDPLSHFFFFFWQIPWFSQKVERSQRNKTMMMNYCDNLIKCVRVCARVCIFQP